MSALTAYRNTVEYGAGAVVAQTQYGVATGVILYPGAIACLNATGYLVPASTSTALFCVGRVSPRTSLPVNTSSPSVANGVYTALVQAGTFFYANSTAGDAITIASRGRLCYLVDDQTVALTSGGGTRSVAGVIVDVDATAGVSVQMGFASGIATQNVAAIIADPGNAGAIPVTASGTCNMTSAGAETRTLAIPTFIGQSITLNVDTSGGNIVVTSAQAINEAANTIMTFGSARDTIKLEAITVAGALRWWVVGTDGCALS